MPRLTDHPSIVRHMAEARRLPSTSLEAGNLRQLCLDAGADDVGFVGIERAELDDQRAEILALYPWARSLISIVCRMNREPIRSPARSVANLEFHHTGDRDNEVARRIVAALESDGIRAVNPSMGFPMEMDRYPGKTWVVSHKPVAVAAGLGHMGIHRNVIHPRFGNFILLATIVTDAEVTEQSLADRLQPLPGMQALCGGLPGGSDRPRWALRLLGLLHAQLPRVHGRVQRLGRADRREPGRHGLSPPRERTPRRPRCGRASASVPTTRPPTAWPSVRPATT